MLITEKIGKIKKNSVNFFKNLRQFFVKINDPEAISKQLTLLIKFNGVNKVLITEKIQKIKKNINDFFEGLRQFFSNLITPKQLARN